MLLRVYGQGFNARMGGLPREPPAGYEGLIGVDLVGTWATGWDEADQQLTAGNRSWSAA